VGFFEFFAKTVKNVLSRQKSVVIKRLIEENKLLREHVKFLEWEIHPPKEKTAEQGKISNNSPRPPPYQIAVLLRF
jgi:hypothetical protein